MSKIVCDFCGTSYPETATQCPICGCVRPGSIGAVNASADGNVPNGNYNYVKGGRFSKSNVKKRNQGKVYAPEDSIEHIRQGNGSNKGLIVAIVLLFVAVLAVGVYIAVRLFSDGSAPSSVQTPGGAVFTVSTQGQAGTDATEDDQTSTESQPTVIRCEEVSVTRKPPEFEKENAAFLLNIETYPENTTEKIEFSTADDKVATVSDDGLITAVGFGETEITVKCGSVETVITVKCTFGEAPPTEPTEPTEPELTFELSTYTGELDIQFSRKNESCNIYSGTVPVDQIVWSSDNEEVATFVNGVVTATGAGMTKIRAKYGNQEIECIVRCLSSVGTYEPPVVEEPEQEQEQEPDYSISETDVSIVVGETFLLTLRDKDKNLVTVTWQPENAGICTVAGNNIKGIAQGTTVVYTVYNGIKYACIVRVR